MGCGGGGERRGICQKKYSEEKKRFCDSNALARVNSFNKKGGKDFKKLGEGKKYSF